ncbi:hypothetical protein [Zhihengliuella halotolerans]|uniref:Uncharacterized protein n=1 Tax=Zhihengliuella halotolerans TaxID=370736 RepID=A0A4Q8AC17_9MICC|nr:hypothetical protein [Zhihengliuella halotolerans]RZU61737.1 hypothetical protein EV380_1315 [Zhihengliuella halotolerans]
MQTYPGRDPLAEALAGEITVRKFRVMLEHLPPANPVARELDSAWSQSEWLLWHIDSRVASLHAAFSSALRAKGAAPVEPKFLDTPKSRADPAQKARIEQKHEAERADLMSVLARPDPR